MLMKTTAADLCNKQHCVDQILQTEDELLATCEYIEIQPRDGWE